MNNSDDGKYGIQGYDISSKWSKYTVQQGAILIQDDDAGIYLRKYRRDGKETFLFQRMNLYLGERKFHISCEFKAIRASYIVKTYIENSINEDERIIDFLLLKVAFWPKSRVESAQVFRDILYSKINR